jgi:hypothetical protein
VPSFGVLATSGGTVVFSHHSQSAASVTFAKRVDSAALTIVTGCPPSNVVPAHREGPEAGRRPAVLTRSPSASDPPDGNAELAALWWSAPPRAAQRSRRARSSRPNVSVLWWRKKRVNGSARRSPLPTGLGCPCERVAAPRSVSLSALSSAWMGQKARATILQAANQGSRAPPQPPS